MWMAIAVTATIFAIGILFGHFEEETPKAKRVMKVILVLGTVGALSHSFGTFWGLAPVALLLVGVVVVHGWWLPHRHGINGWTGEPKDKYYELRGWRTKASAATSKEI